MPDPLTEAVCHACGINPQEITPSFRHTIHNAVTELRTVRASPSEVGPRAAVYRGMFPSMPLTPASLAKWWSACDPARQFEAPAEPKGWAAVRKWRGHDIAFGAANRWIDERSKFPTIAEFWDEYENVWRDRWEQEKRVLRLVPPMQPPTELSQEAVHLWRASLGQPEEGCLCDSCTMARQIMERQG